MKILVIPDIHGNKKALENIKNNIDNVDEVVVLGDYFDSFNKNERGVNALNLFNDICNFARENKKVHLLWGNHDLENYLRRGKCSGFQSDSYKIYHSAIIKNMDIVKLCCELDGWVFSHAGIGKKWFERVLEMPKLFMVKGNTDVDTLNNFCNFAMLNYLRKEKYDYDENEFFQTYFSFYPLDFSNYGKHIEQTPLWIRPMALIHGGLAFPKQIVGHSEVCRSGPAPLFIEGNNEEKLVLCDTPAHDTFLIFDTEKEYEWRKD